MHIALARKYRPRAFADLVGQEHVARALRGAIEQNRVAHGYLLCGPRGVGKTTAARILAMALNCETRLGGKATGGEPCGSCSSCDRIWSGSASLDVVEIDAASNRGVDDARELRERAMYAASQEGRHKVYIIDEAHMLTREAWNTLLKVLEEPPSGVVFVFATTEPHRITNTAAPVMSRLQRFEFRRVGPLSIAARLNEVAKAEGLNVEPDAVELIARLADGGLRDALSVLDQVIAFGAGAVTAARVRDVLGLVADESFAEVFRIALDRDGAAVFPLVARLVEAGVDLVEFAGGTGDLWRAALAMSLGGQPDGISGALTAAIAPRIGEREAGDYLRLLRSIEESEEAIRRGASPRLAVETLLVRWALMDRTIDITELLEGGASAPARPRAERRENAAAGSPAQRVAEPRVEPKAAAPAAAPVAASIPPGSAATIAAVPEAAHGAGRLTRSAVQSAWPRILGFLIEARKPLVATALEHATIHSAADGVVVIDPGSDNAIGTESATRHRTIIETALGREFGARIRLELVGEAPAAAPLPAPQAAPAARPAGPVAAEQPAPPALEAPADHDAAPAPQPPPSRRVTVSGARAERARALKGRDPALDRAVEALDLELLD